MCELSLFVACDHTDLSLCELRIKAYTENWRNTLNGGLKTWKRNNSYKQTYNFYDAQRLHGLLDAERKHKDQS